MMRIVLIRPGSTEFDEQGRIKGTLSIPLSEQGARQVALAVDQLAQIGIDVVYTSPCESARQTAEAVAESLGVKLQPMEKLQNLNQGLWQGKLIEEVRQRQPKVYRQWQDHPETICPPEGEMLASARDRVQSVLGKIFKKRKAGVIALVVPEPLASLIRCYLVGNDLGDLWEIECACGSWERIDVEPGELVAT